MGASLFPQNASYNPTGPVGALAYWTAEAITKQYLKKSWPAGAGLTLRGRQRSHECVTVSCCRPLRCLRSVPGPASGRRCRAWQDAVSRPASPATASKPDALGPSLKGVVGRKAAALDDFRYSAPMRRANLIWDDANLRAYIADPQATVKGNRMPFGGLRAASDVDDIVAYLKTLQ